jgi:signal transduction histidine kinase
VSKVVAPGAYGIAAGAERGVGSSQWLQLLPAAMPVPVAVMRRSDGTVLFANQALADVLQLTVDQIQGHLIDDVLAHPDSRATLLRCLVDRSDGIDVSGTRRDGSQLLLEASVRVIDTDDDAVLVLLNDVAEQRRTQAELLDLARFPDMNPGPVLRIDREATVLRVNPAARRLFGGDEAIIGRSWLDTCPGMTAQLWDEVLAAGGVHVLHEAEIGDAAISFTHLLSPTSGFVFVFGADITKRRRAEHKLAEQAGELAELARFPDMNPGPVLRIDLEGNVLLANRAAQQVFGERVVNGRWPELYPAAARLWDTILKAPEPVQVEARLGQRDYVFAHRMDPRTSLVFVYGNDVTEQRQTEHALRQSEKMATLGTLAAGVAHELNNPAAATRRSAEQLRDALARLEKAHLALDGAALTDDAREVLVTMDQQARSRAAQPSPLGSVERSDREAELEDWLDDHDIADAWELSSALVEQGVNGGTLEELATILPPQVLPLALQWSAAAYGVHRLAHEIGEGAARISEIVGALKSYSYLGQAPEQQAVDIHEGLDNTLVILRHKLKGGIEVVRDYGDLPPVPAHGGELNQVWTNILDNAAGAMNGQGSITIRTRRDGNWAVIDITDDGPGIPAQVVPQVFDPFFTTKAPGEGTGLGLSTTYSIVTEKHRGQIAVVSRPGATTFTVRLPLTRPAREE